MSLYHRELPTIVMRNLVVRHRNSGYTTTICTYAEDIRHWYAVEIKGKKIVDRTRYSKIEFDFMGV
jgi:hypothetical protein